MLEAIRRRGGCLLIGGVVILAGCGGSKDASTPAHDSADSMFVRDMLVHHARALDLGRLAVARGTDPRVRAFGARIVREQTPEHARLQSWVTTLRLTADPTVDRAMASGYVSDASYAALQKLTGAAFDRQVLLLSASSEDGAVKMAEAEIAKGEYQPALALAHSIVGARNTEIPELRNLAQRL